MSGFPLVIKMFEAANMKMTHALFDDFYMAVPSISESSKYGVACFSPSAMEKMEKHLSLLTAPKADSSS